MENKINVAELLKDCPTGMELDCLMYDNLYFDSLNADYYGTINCYTLNDGVKISIKFTKYGTFNNHTGAKCVIFPKGKTTWEGFVPPCKFKDGDIVAHQNHMGTWIGIYHRHDYLDESFSSYCCIGRDGKFWAVSNNGHGYYKTRLATEEEKANLFQAIKDNGYKWNSEAKTLEELIELKFKVGDRVKHKTRISLGDVVTEIKDTHYILNDDLALPFTFQDEYELVPNKFDISALKPFDKVLVRGDVGQKWTHDFFGFMDKDKGCPFVCVGHYVIQCIPFEGNEHLLGKTDDCSNFYRTWE